MQSAASSVCPQHLPPVFSASPTLHLHLSCRPRAPPLSLPPGAGPHPCTAFDPSPTTKLNPRPEPCQGGRIPPQSQRADLQSHEMQPLGISKLALSNVSRHRAAETHKAWFPRDPNRARTREHHGGVHICGCRHELSLREGKQ
jgi:hypothetical protein